MSPRSPQPHQHDWYAILDVSPQADADAIKAAHRRRARDLHPDVNGAADATERMANLNRARDVLLDPAARAAYDRARAPSRTHAPTRIRFSFGAEPTAAPSKPPPPQSRAAAAQEAIRWRFDARTGPQQEDWYAFLGVNPWSSDAEVEQAVVRLAPEAEAAGLAPNERRNRQAKLRMAWETLGKRSQRSAYDATRPPWRPPATGLQDYYGLVGARRSASLEEIGAAVTAASKAIGPRAWNAELRRREAQLQEAWWVLRDPDRRAAYDAAIGGRHSRPR